MRRLVQRRFQVPVAALLAVVLVSLGAGAWAGNVSDHGTKRMHELTGTARLLNGAGLTSFDTGRTEDQRSFYAQAVWVENAGPSGDGHRFGCLRLDRDVPVRIGWTEVARPDGGSFQAVTWVDCG